MLIRKLLSMNQAKNEGGKGMKKEKRKLKEGKVKKHERTINRKGVKDTKADCRQIDEYRPKLA